MKKNNFLIFIIVILVILLAVCLVIIYKNNYLGTKSEVLSSGENITSEESLKENTAEVSNVAEENDVVEEITDEERKEIEEYIDIICNCNVRLPEFTDIKNADKEWIYAHIDRDKYITYATEDEINENLQSILGDNLSINVKEDQKLLSDTNSFIPRYEETAGKYFLPAFGLDRRVSYTINSVSKNNDSYIVNVVEYYLTRDLEKNSDDYLAVCTYNDEQNKLIKVFEREENQEEQEVIEKVLNRKDEFQSYNISLILRENKLYVERIEKI